MVFQYQTHNHSKKQVKHLDNRRLRQRIRARNAQHLRCNGPVRNSVSFVYYPNIISLVTSQNKKHKNIYNCMSDKIESPLKQFDDFITQLTAHELKVYFHLCAISTPAIRNIQEELECDVLDEMLPKQIVESTMMFIPPTIAQAFDMVSKIKSNACSCFILRTNVPIEMSIYIPSVEEVTKTECPNNIKALLSSPESGNYSLGKRLFINFYDKILPENEYIEPSWLTQDMILELTKDESITETTR